MDIERALTESIERWILKRDDSADEKLIFLLCHLGVSTRSELFEMEYAGEAASVIAELMYRNADDDAESMGGLQKYRLEGHFGRKKKSSQFARRFRIKADENWEEEEFSEPATQKGLLSQLMKHNEKNNIASLGSMNSMIKSLQSELARKDRRIDQLEEKVMAQVEIREQLVSRDHERKLVEIQLIKSEDRKDEIFETVKMLAPIAINRLTGKDLFKDADDPLSMQLKSLIDSMDVDQMQGLMGVLKPAQSAVLLDLVQHYQKSEAEKKKNGGLKALPGGS